MNKNKRNNNETFSNDKPAEDAREKSQDGGNSEEASSVFQKKITEGLEEAFDYVLENRREYHSKYPDKIPSRSDISSLINTYTRNNAVISGGASLIPGPWGMAAVVPELVVVIRNQIQMIYDIGAAHGKSEQITKELLMGIFISALGSSAGSLLTIHGTKILVRRASLRAIQKLIAMLGGRITQQAIKSAVAKWLPFVGAAAMATWTGYTTNQIGEKADEIFQLDIDDDPETVDIELA